jgi:hypothetical protein
MKTPDDLLRTAENRLTEALAVYESGGHGVHAAEFYELRVQAAIFNYDICREVVSLWKHEPNGFALNVALKNIVHKLYEYDKALSGKLVNRVLTLARAREVEIHNDDIRNERKKWRGQLSKLQKWADVRNETSGHYGKNIAKQVALLKQLDRKEVMAVAAAFLAFNIVVLKALTRVGRGK